MKKVIFLFVLAFVSICSYAQEPGNNIGSSLYSMKQKFPELRYLKTDTKGDEYEDGYPQDGIATFFYFKDNYVIEECMICQSDDGFSLEWYNSMVTAFEKNYHNALGKNTQYVKQYVFSTFNVNLIYVSENGKNTAMIVYEKSNTSNQSSSYQNSSRQTYEAPRQQQTYVAPAPKGKVEWYDIDYTEDRQYVNGMQSVGSFSATSSPVLFGSRSYDDAFQSAIKKIQKKAAKKGARRLLVTYKSSLNWDFLTVKVEAIGYK